MHSEVNKLTECLAPDEFGTVFGNSTARSFKNCTSFLRRQPQIFGNVTIVLHQKEHFEQIELSAKLPDYIVQARCF